MAKMTLDEKLDKADEFLAEFKLLVRKYVPDYDSAESDFVMMLQDRTSVYSPYIWSDKKVLPYE